MSLDKDIDRCFFDLVAPDAYTHGLEHAGAYYLYIGVGSFELLQHLWEMKH